MRHAPRGAVHVPRPRVHAGARVAHHRSAHGGHAPARVGLLGADRRAVGRAEGRRRHGALRRDLLRRRGGVHPGAGRRGRGGRDGVVPARVRLQLRRQRDPARAGGAGRGAGHEAPARVRDDRVPDGLAPASATTVPTSASAPTAASCRASTCGWSTPTARRRAGRRWASSSCAGRSACSATSTRSTPATASTPTAGSAAATSASSMTAGLHHGDRPHQGHHQPRRREAVGSGDRGPAAPSPRRRRRRGGRRAAPAAGRGAGRVRDPASRRDGVRRRGLASSSRPRASRRRRSPASS